MRILRMVIMAMVKLQKSVLRILDSLQAQKTNSSQKKNTTVTFNGVKNYYNFLLLFNNRQPILSWLTTMPTIKYL